MQTVQIDVKSKGKVVATTSVELPTLEEVVDMPTERQVACVKAMHYGLRVSAANAAREKAIGGPKSVYAMIARALKDHPDAAARVAAELGIQLPVA